MTTYKALVNYSWIPFDDMDWVQEMNWIKEVFDSRFNWNADVAF